MTSTTHTTSHSSNDQVKELCFIIHNAKTEEERNNAKWELVYSFKDNVKHTCQEYLKNIYGKNVDFESKNIYDLIDVCYDVLFEYAEKYDPEHSSGASLFTYARKEMKNKKALFILQSLSEEETAILYTMTDINNNYKPISEREGVRRLEVMGFNIKRGTLNSRREALKKKVWSALYDTDYKYVA
jgi:hypothetical protein